MCSFVENKFFPLTILVLVKISNCAYSTEALPTRICIVAINIHLSIYYTSADFTHQHSCIFLHMYKVAMDKHTHNHHMQQNMIHLGTTV